MSGCLEGWQGSAGERERGRAHRGGLMGSQQREQGWRAGGWESRRAGAAGGPALAAVATAQLITAHSLGASGEAVREEVTLITDT